MLLLPLGAHGASSVSAMAKKIAQMQELYNAILKDAKKLDAQKACFPGLDEALEAARKGV